MQCKKTNINELKLFKLNKLLHGANRMKLEIKKKAEKIVSKWILNCLNNHGSKKKSQTLLAILRYKFFNKSNKKILGFSQSLKFMFMFASPMNTLAKRQVKFIISLMTVKKILHTTNKGESPVLYRLYQPPTRSDNEAPK